MRKNPVPREPEPELNLAPIMNMVVILIPLLLLSVVFLKVGVINVTTPSLSPGVETDSSAAESLDLTVAIDGRGFHIATANTQIPPIEGCPQTGPTICLSEVGAKPRRFAPNADEANLEAALSAYDWTSLYNQLVQIKKANAGETTIKITADPDVPYAAIVRVMDVARFRLTADSYREPSAFWAARYAMEGSQQAALFPDPILAIAR